MTEKLGNLIFLNLNLISHRDLIDAKGLIPKIVDLLKVNQLRLLVLIVLNLLSLDDKIRFAFAYRECISLVLFLYLEQ